MDLQNEDSRKIDSELPVALHVEHASFEWESLRTIPLPVSLVVLRELGTGRWGLSREWSRTEKGRKMSNLYPMGLLREGQRCQQSRPARA